MSPATVFDFESLEVAIYESGSVSVVWEPDTKKKAVATFSTPAASPCNGSSLVSGLGSLQIKCNVCAKYKFTIAGTGCSHEPAPGLSIIRRRGLDPMDYVYETLMSAQSAASGSPETPLGERCTGTSPMEPAPGFDELEKEISLICGDKITLALGIAEYFCAASEVTVTIELVEPPP